MSLKESQKKLLRGLGHQLKPVITVGDAGLSPALLAEFEATIKHHELIKVRVRTRDRQLRDALIGELCAAESTELVTRIGNVALIYRRNDQESRIPLPTA